MCDIEAGGGRLVESYLKDQPEVFQQGNMYYFLGDESDSL